MQKNQGWRTREVSRDKGESWEPEIPTVFSCLSGSVGCSRLVGPGLRRDWGGEDPD